MPVRVAALVGIRRLVVERDPFTIKKLPQLLRLFRGNLGDEDSYMYLTAIQGLSALGDVEPQLIIPAIVADYTNPSSSISVPVKLKLGEALVKIAQRLGDMLHVYAHHVVAAFLQTASQASDPDLRASGLSNLGTMCYSLRFALHPWIRDIIDSVFARLACDHDVVVKRAAVFVFDQLLAGFGTKVFEFLLSQDLARIVTVMESLQASEADPVICYHIQHACFTLSQAMQDSVDLSLKSLLTPDEERVLNLFKV